MNSKDVLRANLYSILTEAGYDRDSIIGILSDQLQLQQANMNVVLDAINNAKDFAGLKKTLKSTGTLGKKIFSDQNYTTLSIKDPKEVQDDFNALNEQIVLGLQKGAEAVVAVEEETTEETTETNNGV